MNATPRSQVSLCAYCRPYRHWFGWEHSNSSTRQDVHLRQVALFNGTQLRDLHVSASSRIPAHHLLPCPPMCCQLVSPPAAMAEGILSHLAHCPSTPPAFIVLSVVAPLEIDSSRCIPTLYSVEPGSKRLHDCHWNRSLVLHLALEYVTQVFAALVGLALCIGCWPPIWVSIHTMRGWGV